MSINRKDPTRCVESIYGGSFHPHQCRNKRTVGEFCKIHDPVRRAADAKARADASRAEWDARVFEAARARSARERADSALELVLRLADDVRAGQPILPDSLAARRIVELADLALAARKVAT